MDQNLEKSLELGNYMVAFNRKFQILKEQHKADSMYFYKGGEFFVDQSLVSFVNTLISLNQTFSVLIDSHQNPIYVEDLKQFLDEIVSVYITSSNKFSTELTKLKKNRSVKGLIE